MSTLDDYLFQVGKAASQFQFLEEGQAPGVGHNNLNNLSEALDGSYI